MNTIIAYTAGLFTLILSDYLFLNVLMKEYYSKLLSPAITLEFNVYAGIIFYIIYVVGIFIFAINPNLESGDIWKAVLYGAMFGFFCYMTYDLTNIATIKNWPTIFVFLDIAWGTFISAAVTGIIYKIIFLIK